VGVEQNKAHDEETAMIIKEPQEVECMNALIAVSEAFNRSFYAFTLNPNDIADMLLHCGCSTFQWKRKTKVVSALMIFYTK